MSNKIANAFSYIIPFISLFIGSFILGKNTNNKGFIEGIKFGSIFIVLFILLNIILKLGFTKESIILYMIMIISSMTGSILGINKRK